MASEYLRRSLHNLPAPVPGLLGCPQFSRHLIRLNSFFCFLCSLALVLGSHAAWIPALQLFLCSSLLFGGEPLPDPTLSTLATVSMSPLLVSLSCRLTPLQPVRQPAPQPSHVLSGAAGKYLFQHQIQAASVIPKLRVFHESLLTGTTSLSYFCPS